MKNTIIKIFTALTFVFFLANAAAQSSQLSVRLTEYDADTRMSKIHIQNNAGFDLNEIDLYVNDFRTGRVAGTLPEGKAVMYFQSVNPGTHEIKITTKEGIEFKKEMKFGDISQITETTQPKNPSEQIVNEEYQEYLREIQIEQEIRKQRQQEGLQEKKPQPVQQGFIEEKELSKKQESNKIIAVIIVIVILLFILPYLFKKKKRIR